VQQRRAGFPRLLSSGGFDTLLAAILAILSVALGWNQGQPAAAALDVATCAAAALASRWPRTAGVGLGLLLAAQFLAPGEWASMGEYAALIPILTTGMRGHRRVRAWMTVGYGVLLLALLFRDYPGDPLFLLGALIWVALIGVLWGIGDLFTSYQRALAKAGDAALLEQRLALTRELHDTTARTLARALIQAQDLRDRDGLTDLDAVLDGMRQATAELRSALDVLRDPSPSTPGDRSTSPLAQVLDDGRTHLAAQGFVATVTVEGELAAVPASPAAVLATVFGELVENVVRHGVTGRPVGIIVSVTAQAVDMVVMNDTTAPIGAARPSSRGLGLAGVRERLAAVDGVLEARQEGTRWLAHLRVPLPAG
jgi:signal transduction histidine kinase